MLRGPRAFLFAVVILMLAIVGFRYEQYVIERNFDVIANTVCDPQIEECFVLDCDPDTDEECDVTPYKKVAIIANQAPQCLFEHSCEEFSCDGRASCEITYCTEEALEEGELCSVRVEPEPVLEGEVIVEPEPES